MAKITNILKNYLSGHPQGRIEVIIELTPLSLTEGITLSRSEKIAEMKNAFEMEAKPLAAAIENLGGFIVDSAWLNQTVKASIPASNIDKVAQLDVVSIIDLPKALTR